MRESKFGIKPYQSFSAIITIKQTYILIIFFYIYYSTQGFNHLFTILFSRPKFVYVYTCMSSFMYLSGFELFAALER